MPIINVHGENDVTVVREETELRKFNEKHFLCSDGSVMAVTYSKDVHYLDSNGKYQTIDNTLKYSESKKEYYSDGNPNFQVSFDTKSNLPGFSLKNNKGNDLQTVTLVDLKLTSSSNVQLRTESKRFTIENGRKIDVVGSKKTDDYIFSIPEIHSELKYEKALGDGISAEYIIDGNTVKENIIFSSKTEYSSIKTMYDMEGLNIVVAEDGALWLYDGNEELAYFVDAPYMYDSVGSVCPSISVSAENVGGTWVVKYIPDVKWVESDDRVYPIVFDPMTSRASSRSFVDMFNTSTNGTTPSTSYDDVLKVGMECYSTQESYDLQYVHRTFIGPDSYPTIPEGNEILSMELILTAKSVIGSGGVDLYKIAGNRNFINNNYSLGSLIDSQCYPSSTNKCTFELPASYYGETSGYVIKDSFENSTNEGPHYITFYSSRSTSTIVRPMIVVNYAPNVLNNKTTALYNFVDKCYMKADTDDVVSTTLNATQDCEWKFVKGNDNTYRIVSNSDKCLSANSNGTLSLIDMPDDFSSNTNALWYMTVDGINITITNVQYGFGLFVENSSNGTQICRIDTGLISSLQDRQWGMGRVLTDEVLTFESVGDNDKYLKHINGRPAAGCSIIVGGDDREIDLKNLSPDDAWEYIGKFAENTGSYTEDELNDTRLDLSLSCKIAFRIRFNGSKQAYYLMPISASNGLSKTVQWTGSAFQTTNDCVDWSEDSANWNNAMLDIELQTDGSYHIKLHSSTNQVLLLTNNGDGNGVTFETVNSAKKQSWTLDEYMYRSPVPNSLDEYIEYPYSDVEKHYSELGFISPLADNVTLNQTSDFGVRQLVNEKSLDFHKGVDINVQYKELFATYGGMVVDAGYNSEIGNYVKIRTTEKAYENSDYDICVVYMHLQSIEVQKYQCVSIGDKIGVSGNTPNFAPHLHYGVFLNKYNETDFSTIEFPLETHWFLPILDNYS